MALNEEQILGRIDDIEAMLNGLAIFVAAREADIKLDLEDDRTKAFIKDHLGRSTEFRLQKTGVMAGDGYMDAAAIAKAQKLVRELKDAFYEGP